MKLRSLFAVLVGCTIALSGCEKNEADSTSIPNDDTSSLEFALLATSAVADSTAPDSTHYGRGHHHGGSGKNCQVEEVEVTDLPAAITAYVAENYAGATVERAGKANNRGYILHVKKSDGTLVGLFFDANGTFVSEKSHRATHGTPVTISELPTEVTTYISTNYAGATIEKAIKDAQGNTLVLIKKSDATVAGLVFDAAGAFTSEVTVKDLPRGHGKGRH
ncbi:hypothetical protein AHMF7605_06535 [Adhaeribacter arboris]|uniref:Putative beta-lactamase-inhibitor-like PepSY-like domain-containing protein n=1 Tax=Adhaeribacter arboris TaxID=2072846 RepID=A0A2T2YCH4_9BACT|nr:PepSY-like domain-containing protein [Adhaeribacter arboris]PSR53209.1 hypothetical protein AHMF7605_06535 [Adhaeribacter arboris]